MVNVGLSWSSIVGIALAVSGGGLYFLRTLRPGLARDHDIFFAAVALVCGGILFFQGWRQDPILQFGQFLLAGSAIWFAFEAIRLRSIATEQAKRSTPVVDDSRPVSRVYRAELDELPVMDERPTTRRIRGTRDSRSSQTDGYGDDYEDEPRRRPSTRTSRARLDSSEDRPRKRRPSTRLDDAPKTPSDRSSDLGNYWDDDVASEDMSYSGSTYRSGRNSGSSRSQRPRSSSESTGRRPSAEPSDYVDYRPINNYEDDADSANQFD